MGLENIFNKKRLKEYSLVAVMTESCAIVGNQIGARLPSRWIDFDFVDNLTNVIETHSGDYVGGTIGYCLGYYHNNREKFRDENGRFKWGEFTKDYLKIMVYDIPLTSATYVISGLITYQFIKNDADETLVGLVNWFSTMVIWNTGNYFLYNIIKFNEDEKLFKQIYNKIAK